MSKKSSRREAPFELDGMLWKPVDGAMVTAEQFAAARALFSELRV